LTNTTATTAPRLDTTQVRQWLHLLHHNSPGLTHICATGDWTGKTFTRDQLDDAVAYITRLDAERREGIYARITTMRTPPEAGKRGGATDTAALPALWADLDIAGPGHAEQGLPPNEDAARQIITTSGLPEPTLWIHSGGGLYPIWLLATPAAPNNDDDLAALKQLSADWQKVIEHAAARLGWHYGRGVGDLARVLRVPGTVNRKAGLARPCQIITGIGPHYTLEQLLEACAAAQPPAPTPATTTLLGSAMTPAGPARDRQDDDPGEDFNRRATWAEVLEPHGWTWHNSVDGVDQWTRPGKQTGISATTNAMGTDRLHVFTTSAPPFVAGESYHKFAAYTLLNHAGDYSAAARELLARGYGTPIDHSAQAQADLDFLVPNWRQQQQQAEAAAAASSTTTRSTSTPARYFTETGSLLVGVLAKDVLGQGPLAVGRDDILWAYQDGAWTPHRYVVRNRLVKLLGDRYRRGHATHVEDVIRAEVPLITGDPVEQWINFRNGLLDWRTGELHPHTPDVLTTVQLAVDWTPTAACPRFDQFLSEVVPADMTNVVWELIGYLMYSGNPLHKAVMLMGTGRNGKGTFLRAITTLLGTRNLTAASLHDLVTNRFATASLYGKLANIAGDIDATYLESTAIFKAITGQDQISAEHKGRDRFQFTPWAVPVFSANEIPPSADTTTGYLSRWLPIPFPNSFLGREDRNLDNQLATELPGIAAKAIPALRRLMARGEFERPLSLMQALDEFARRVDQVRAWLADCCEPIPPPPHDPAVCQFMPRTAIYEAYRRWCHRDGHRPLSAAKFYDRLVGAGATPTKVMGQRGFRGVEITDSASMLTQSPGAHRSDTDRDEESILGAGQGQARGSLHNANLPLPETGADQVKRSDAEPLGAARAGFSDFLHSKADLGSAPRSNPREIRGWGKAAPPAPTAPNPLATASNPANCRHCGKPLDPVLAPHWQQQQLHPSCAPEGAPQ